jgi:hypothetical protein
VAGKPAPLISQDPHETSARRMTRLKMRETVVYYAYA